MGYSSWSSGPNGVPETGTVVLTLLILLVSALYSSVGQAGGSGYLAVMAYMNVTPDVMRPTAPVLNVLVARIATARLWRSRPARLSLAWPLMVASVPSAIVGGRTESPSRGLQPAGRCRPAPGCSAPNSLQEARVR